MTVVLIAVYIPIGFIGGLTGALFTEFAFTLDGTVTVSAVIALTLSPMLCARFLKPHNDPTISNWERRTVSFIDGQFDRLHNGYMRLLHASLDQVSRSEEHTSELQSLMRISYAVFCLKKKIHIITIN